MIGITRSLAIINTSAQGWSLATARQLAERTTEGQAERAEFVKLVTQAQALMRATASHER